MRPAAPYLPHHVPYAPAAAGMFYPPPMHPMMQHMYMQMSDNQLSNQSRPSAPQPNFAVKVGTQISSDHLRLPIQAPTSGYKV